jgi:hypothetical protein
VTALAGVIVDAPSGDATCTFLPAVLLVVIINNAAKVDKVLDANASLEMALSSAQPSSQ